jgi:hypothetical protein
LPSRRLLPHQKTTRISKQITIVHNLDAIAKTSK